MNRICAFAIGTLLTFGLGGFAQQTPVTPPVDEQAKVLAERLSLTAAQQAKLRPILQRLDDATKRLMQDESLSREERLAKVRPQRMQADKKIRAFLSNDQKKKLDEYLSGPHDEIHGGLSGATQAPKQ